MRASIGVFALCSIICLTSCINGATAQACSSKIASTVFGDSTSSSYATATARDDDVDVCNDITKGKSTCCTAEGYATLKTIVDGVKTKKSKTLSTWRTSWNTILYSVQHLDSANFDDIYDKLPSSLKSAANYFGFSNSATKTYLKKALAAGETSNLNDAQVKALSDKLESTIGKAFDDAESYHAGVACLVCHPEASRVVTSAADGSMSVKMSKSTCDRLKKSQDDLQTQTWQVLAEVAYPPYAALQKAVFKTPMTREEFIQHVHNKFATGKTSAQHLANTDNAEDLEETLLGSAPSLSDLGGVVSTTGAKRALTKRSRELVDVSDAVPALHKVCDADTASEDEAAVVARAPTPTFNAFASADGIAQSFEDFAKKVKNAVLEAVHQDSTKTSAALSSHSITTALLSIMVASLLSILHL